MSVLRQRADVVGTAVPPRLQVVIAIPGLDGHDRGAKVVARALGDVGHEEVYTSLRPTPQQVLATVDALGVDPRDVREPTC